MWHDSDMWMVYDVDVSPVLDRVYIYGVLEFEWKFDDETDTYPNHTLECTHLFISGGRLIIGWEDNPMLGYVDIILRGTPFTEELATPYDGPIVGAKAIGKYYNR